MGELESEAVVCFDVLPRFLVSADVGVLTGVDTRSSGVGGAPTMSCSGRTVTQPSPVGGIVLRQHIQRCVLGFRSQTENFGRQSCRPGWILHKTSQRRIAVAGSQYRSRRNRYYVDQRRLSGAFASGYSSSKRNHGQEELGVILALSISQVQA